MGKKKTARANGIVVCFCDSAKLDDENIAGIADEVCEQLEGIRAGGAERFGGLLVLPGTPDGAEAFARLVGNFAAAGLVSATIGRVDVPPEQLN